MKHESTLTRPGDGRVRIVTKLNTGNTNNTFKYVQNVFTCVAGSNEWVIAAEIAKVVTDMELYRAKMKLHDKIKPEPPDLDTRNVTTHNGTVSVI